MGFAAGGSYPLALAETIAAFGGLAWLPAKVNLKAAFNILFVVVLMLAQGVPVPTSLASARPACAAGCRHCGKCCVQRSCNSSQPLPAAPSRAAEAKRPQMLPAVAAICATLPEDRAPHPASLQAFLPRSFGVPLYRRNCAFLI